jgi:transcriptional regulator with XRE-family HTH domain
MSNEIDDLLKEIQYKTVPKLTIEQIAARIGYSRPHLTKQKKAGDNETIKKLLKAEFADILQNDAKDTKSNIEAKDPRAPYKKDEDYQTKYIKLLEQQAEDRKKIEDLTTKVEELKTLIKTNLDGFSEMLNVNWKFQANVNDAMLEFLAKQQKRADVQQFQAEVYNKAPLRQQYSLSVKDIDGKDK